MSLLAIPIVLVGIITRGRGRAPSNPDDGFVRTNDAVLGVSKDDLGRELTDDTRR